MGILDRISDLMRANVNDMITKAENPEKMINQMILDMEEQMDIARGEVSKAVAEERKLLKYYQDEKRRVNEWLSKAELAVKGGDDTLAMEALERKNKHEEICTQYQNQYEEQKEASEAFKTALITLQTKIEDVKRQKSVLIARSKRAQAQDKVNSVVRDLNNEDAFSKFQRMAERIEEQEFINQATADLNALTEDNQLDKKFAALDKKTTLADELEALKAKIKA